MIDMKTLFDRLKPDIKEQLILQEPLFPTLCGDLIKLLKENVAITELKLGDLNNLSNFKKGYTTKITELYEMFND
tara:strand:+ start:878 stop:1102 length:225 start_codon:yes stop_codon:yes gene_type:complete